MSLADPSPMTRGSAASVVARLVGVSKRYPGVVALDNVDFEIAAGQVRALLGKNGAGKSTLIRMLAGVETPDAGTVEICGHTLAASGAQRAREAARQGVRVVHQELSLAPNMTVAENLFLGTWPQRGGVIRSTAMAQAAHEALARVGLMLDPGRIVSGLSAAQCQLIEIARALIGAPRLVILDEPTSSLAASEVQHVFDAVQRIAAAGIAVIYVSHRMKEIREVASDATVMRDGKVTSTAPLQGADTEQIVQRMLGPRSHAERVVAARPAGPVLISVRELALPPKLQGASFELRSGEVLGIAGLLGSGRTELLRAIAGLDRVASGSVHLNGCDVTNTGFRKMLAQGIAITPENRKEGGIFALLGADENIVLTDPAQVARSGVFSARRVRDATLKIIQRLSVKIATPETAIGTLSGGNQQKIVIGRWVYAGSKVLLLDEPTRGVDIEAKEQIYAIVRELAAQGHAIVFVSSEVEELPQVCDRVLVLRQGCIHDEYTAPTDADALMAACIDGE